MDRRIFTELSDYHQDKSLMLLMRMIGRPVDPSNPSDVTLALANAYYYRKAMNKPTSAPPSPAYKRARTQCSQEPYCN